MTFTAPASHAHDTEYIRYLASRSMDVSPSDVPLKNVPLDRKGLTGMLGFNRRQGLSTSKTHQPHQDEFRSQSATSLSKRSPAANATIMRYFSSEDALNSAPLTFKKSRIAINAVRLLPSAKG